MVRNWLFWAPQIGNTGSPTMQCEKKQRVTAKMINNVGIRGSWGDGNQALRRSRVQSCPDLHTVTLPVRLVLLDKGVAGDEVAGYGSGLHPSTHSTCLSRKTHAHESSVKTFSLRDKWFHFGWELHILQTQKESGYDPHWSPAARTVARLCNPISRQCPIKPESLVPCMLRATSTESQTHFTHS